MIVFTTSLLIPKQRNKQKIISLYRILGFFLIWFRRSSRRWLCRNWVILCVFPTIISTHINHSIWKIILYQFVCRQVLRHFLFSQLCCVVLRNVYTFFFVLFYKNIKLHKEGLFSVLNILLVWIFKIFSCQHFRLSGYQKMVFWTFTILRHVSLKPYALI